MSETCESQMVVDETKSGIRGSDSKQKIKHKSVTEIKEKSIEKVKKEILELLEGKKKLVEDLVSALELQEEKKKKLTEDLVSALKLQEGNKMLIGELASAVEEKCKKSWGQKEPYWPSYFDKAIMDLYDENKIKLSDLGKYATKV